MVCRLTDRWRYNVGMSGEPDKARRRVVTIAIAIVGLASSGASYLWSIEPYGISVWEILLAATTIITVARILVVDAIK